MHFRQTKYTSVGVADIPTRPMAIIPQAEYFTTLRALSSSRVVPQSQVGRSAFLMIWFIKTSVRFRPVGGTEKDND
ncbi:hypothetical protein [Leptospira wolbachii]|uniref:hypothetical protein n=1 Tax=Leptospira wolbachii TaxID=29511 RepID=UPI0018DC7F2B|nr:hypothetical protein [Leptospira wolbachii]